MSEKTKSRLMGVGIGLVVFGGAGATGDWEWAAGFVLLGVLAGLGIGHGLWRQRHG